MTDELSRRDLCGRLLAGGLTMAGGAPWAALAGALPSPAPKEGGTERTIALLLFPDLTLLDLVGPLQVLKALPAPFRTIVVAERMEPVTTDSGLALNPEKRLEDVPRPWAVIVP